MANEQLTSIWREAWRPPDRQPAWAWAEEHIRSIPYSPMPGRFRIENSPQIREVLDAIIDPKVRLVSIIASVQSSKTTAPEVALCYIIANLPGPSLWLDQTDEDAKDQSESRLQKIFDECDPVKALFPADRHKRRNQTIHFANGMTLWIVGAHNKTNLQRRSIRWLIHATTAMRCASCNYYFEDADETRRRLNGTGKFIPQNSRAAKENVGFHWNALATMSWGKLAELYLRAKQAARKGDTSLIQQFYQKRLGLPWREYLEDFKLEITTSGYRLGDIWSEEAGIDRFGKIVAPPFQEGVRTIPLRVLTVDCQMDHLYAVVRSWTAEGSSRLLWCERILTFEDVEGIGFEEFAEPKFLGRRESGGAHAQDGQGAPMVFDFGCDLSGKCHEVVDDDTSDMEAVSNPSKPLTPCRAGQRISATLHQGANR